MSCASTPILLQEPCGHTCPGPGTHQVLMERAEVQGSWSPGEHLCGLGRSFVHPASQPASSHREFLQDLSSASLRSVEFML